MLQYLFGFVFLVTNNVMCVLHKCDNGSNMVKAWGELDGHECAAHNLQLCVNKFMKQPRILSVMKSLLGITAHFSRSGKACKALHDIQDSLGLPRSKPPSGSKTRWMGQFHLAVWFVQNAAAMKEYSLQV